MISPILLKDTLQIILGNFTIRELNPLRITCKQWNKVCNRIEQSRIQKVTFLGDMSVLSFHVCNRIEQSRIQKVTFLGDMSVSFIPLDDKESIITSMNTGPVPEYDEYENNFDNDYALIYKLTTDRKRKRTKISAYYKNGKRNKLCDLVFIELFKQDSQFESKIINTYDVPSGNCWILKTEYIKEYISESTEYRLDFRVCDVKEGVMQIVVRGKKMILFKKNRR